MKDKYIEKLKAQHDLFVQEVMKNEIEIRVSEVKQDLKITVTKCYIEIE